jgi:acetyl-CoA acetyltransferase
MWSNVPDRADAYGPALRARYDLAPDRFIDQGESGEIVADRWEITREEMDAFALESHRRAARATAAGRFAAEILPVAVGAAALLIMSGERAAALGLRPRARFHTFALAGVDPIEMLSGPIPATRAALERSGLGIDDIDLAEVNEAFASVPLAWLRDLDADPDRLNVNGGAIALGHPLGATGARLMTSLVHEMERSGARYGLQAMCEGGGTANATILERL